MVGPASSRPRPPGAPSAPNSPIACCTRTPSSRDRPLPYHSSGHVGAAQPEVPRRSHHSPTVMSGSQFSSSHWVTSAVTSRVGRSAMSVITSPCEVSCLATLQTEVEACVKSHWFAAARDHTGSLGAVHGAKRTWPPALRAGGAFGASAGPSGASVPPYRRPSWPSASPPAGRWAGWRFRRRPVGAPPVSRIAAVVALGGLAVVLVTAIVLTTPWHPLGHVPGGTTAPTWHGDFTAAERA